VLTSGTFDRGREYNERRRPVNEVEIDEKSDVNSTYVGGYLQKECVGLDCGWGRCLASPTTTVVVEPRGERNASEGKIRVHMQVLPSEVKQERCRWT